MNTEERKNLAQRAFAIAVNHHYPHAIPDSTYVDVVAQKGEFRCGCGKIGTGTLDRAYEGTFFPSAEDRGSVCITMVTTNSPIISYSYPYHWVHLWNINSDNVTIG
jgi:hypothetical protein